MSTLPITEVREHLSELCAAVAETGEPLTIHREGEPDVMLIPAGSGRAAERIARIAAKPDYVRELREAGERAHAGDTVAMSLDDLKVAVSSHGDRP